MNAPVAAAFAANLKRLRGERDLSVRELAAASGVSEATISGAQNARSGVSLDTAFRLACTLGVKVDDLLAGAYAREATVPQIPGGS